jgi:hypothetical protein
VGGRSSGRLLATVSRSGSFGTTRAGRVADKVAAVVSRNTWKDWLLA